MRFIPYPAGTFLVNVHAIIRIYSSTVIIILNHVTVIPVILRVVLIAHDAGQDLLSSSVIQAFQVRYRSQQGTLMRPVVSSDTHFQVTGQFVITAGPKVAANGSQV